MMIASVMFSLSLLLLAAASNVAMIYVGRVCCGVCTGEEHHLLVGQYFCISTLHSLLYH